MLKTDGKICGKHDGFSQLRAGQSFPRNDTRDMDAGVADSLGKLRHRQPVVKKIFSQCHSLMINDTQNILQHMKHFACIVSSKYDTVETT